MKIALWRTNACPVCKGEHLRPSRREHGEKRSLFWRYYRCRDCKAKFLRPRLALGRLPLILFWIVVLAGLAGLIWMGTQRASRPPALPTE